MQVFGYSCAGLLFESGNSMSLYSQCINLNLTPSNKKNKKTIIIKKKKKCFWLSYTNIQLQKFLLWWCHQWYWAHSRLSFSRKLKLNVFFRRVFLHNLVWHKFLKRSCSIRTPNMKNTDEATNEKI